MRKNIKCLTTLILCGAFLGLFINSTVLSQVKIMPLGNSITSGKIGGNKVGGYRDDLATLLNNEGVTYDLVGSLTDGSGFDADHEGHDGETTDYVNSQIESWLTTYSPDIILIHIGTNDIQGQVPLENIRNNINSIVDKIHHQDNQTAIVLSSLIPRTDNYDTTTTELNDLLLESYYTHLNNGYKIYYAGQNEAFKSNVNWRTHFMYEGDDVHPNENGYQKMAQVYYVEVMNILNESGSIVTDNFNRLDLGSIWAGNPEFQIVNNELSNTATADGWNYLAIYTGQTNPSQVSFRWGKNASPAGINEGGMALLMDRAASTANGYLLLIRSNGYLNLWTVKDGLPEDEVAYIPGTLSQPEAGDEFKVVINTDGAGHHFKCYINGQETGEISDPEKRQGNGASNFAGVILRGNLENNIDDFNLFKEGDTTPPANVTDLRVVNQTTASITLEWTAPGDDENEGLASSYEIRYSKGNITEANFEEATLAPGIPRPVAPGTIQSFVVTGLASSTSYFFALKARDEIPNVSAMSNITSGTTISALSTVDDFERSNLGGEWNADPEFKIASGQLTNSGGADQWDYVAVYNVKKNPVEAWLEWANSVTIEGIARGALVFLDNTNPNANGYMIWVRESDKMLSLWTVVNGKPDNAVINKPWENGPFTAAGDTFKIAVMQDENGNHFDLYKNKQYLTRLSDPPKRQLSTGDFYAGVMLHGGKSNNIEAFGIATEVGEPKFLEYISGNNGEGRVTHSLKDSLIVRVTDNGGNPIEGVTVDYSVISGNGSFDIAASPDDNLRIQAERGILTPPMKVFSDDPNASGGKYITPPSGDPGDGRAKYQIFIQDPGEYIVWGRVKAPSANNNSFFFIMDGGEKITWDLDSREKKWQWDRVSDRGNGTEIKPQVDPVKFNLNAGLHTFTIEEREFKSQLDILIFTKDPNFVPVDKEEYGEYVSDGRGIAAAEYTFGTKAGVETVEAAVPGLTGSPVRFTLTARADSPDSLFAISGNNQEGVGGEQLPKPLVVGITDGYGNPVANIPVMFTAVQGGGTFSEPQPQYTNDSGRVITHFILGTAAQENLVKVTSDSVPGTAVTFNATASSGIAENLKEISGNGQIGRVTERLAAPFVVKVTTATNEPVKNHLVEFKVVTGNGTFDGNALRKINVRTDNHGNAAADFFLGTLSDTCTVRAAAEGKQGQLNGSPIIFWAKGMPDVPKRLEMVSGDGLTGAAGSPLREPFVVKVVDRYGNPVSAHPVVFAVNVGGGKIEGKTTLTKYTEATGEAAVTLTLGPEPQVVNRVQAEAEHAGAPLNGSPLSFKATSGTVAKIQYVAGNQQKGSAGYPLPMPFQVRIVDNFGNPVPEYPVDFVVTKGDGHFNGATDTVVTTNYEGIAELFFTPGLIPGTNHSAESRAYLNGVPLTGNPIKFTATTVGLKQIKYVSGSGQIGEAGTVLPQPIKVQVLDQNNNGVAGQSVNYEVIAGDGSFAGQRQYAVLSGENGIAEVWWTLGATPGDSNNVARARCNYNGSPLQGSPVRFVASARVGKPAKMNVLSNYLSGVVGNALPEPFRIQITDLGGNKIEDYPVTFKVMAGGGNIDGETSKTIKTNANGVASLVLTLGPTTGDTNNVVMATARRGEDHLQGSPAYLKASARTSAASDLVLVSGNNQNSAAGRPLPDPLVVKVTDRAGNGVKGHPVTFTVKAGHGRIDDLDSSKTVETDANGKAQVVFTLSPGAADNNVVQAVSTNGQLPLAGSPITFSARGKAGPVSAVKSSVQGQPAEVPADGSTPCRVTVTLVDEFNNPISNKQVKIIVSGANNLIEPAQKTTDSNGEATFLLKSTKAELKKITAHNVSDAMTVEKAAAVRFLALAATRIDYHAGNAQIANIGTAVDQPLQVKVLDKFENPVIDFPVEFKITAGGGHLYEVQPIFSDTNGIAQATLVVGTIPGVAQTVEAHASGLENSPVRFMASNLNKKATRIESISGNNQTAMSGTILPQPLVVKVLDSEGRAVWNHSVLFKVDLGDGFIDGQKQKHFKSDIFGQVSVQFQLGDEIGMNIVRVISEGLTGSPLTFVANGTAGKASMIYIVGGNNQSTKIGGYLPEPLQIKVTDYNGNGVAGQKVTFTVIEGNASILESQPQVTDNRGLASSRVRLGNHAGLVWVEAEAGDLVYSPLRFKIVALPQPATKMQIVSGDNQNGTIGRELVFPFEVLVTDNYDNPVREVDITFAVVEGTGTLLDGQVSVSDSGGIARNRLKLDTRVGNNKIYAIKSGLKNSPLTFIASGVTNKFPLISPILDVSVKENEPVRFTVRATDGDNEPVTFGARNLPRGAQFDSTGNQEFKWTPDLKQAGRHTIRFLAYDARGGLDAEDVKITVRNVNRPPQLIAKKPAALEVYAPKRDTLTFQIVVNDPDNDPIQFRWYQTFAGRTLLVSTKSHFRFASMEHPAGSYQVHATASDGTDSIKVVWKMLWTSVELSGFSAELSAFHGVRLTWESRFEAENAGFNILRSVAKNGTYAQINSQPIPANSSLKYEYIDENVIAGRTYYYQLEDIDLGGKRTLHEPIAVTIAQPKQFELAQNFPNPFNPTTSIRYQLPQAATVRLSVFNLLGQEVVTLVNEKQNAGYYTLQWDGRNQSGQTVASGIYLYRIEAGEFRVTKRMVLLK